MDERPPVWVGHIAMVARDVEKSAAFWTKIIPRVVYGGSDMAIFELRGGTHLLIFPGEPTPGDAPFDLMVDDLDATRASWAAEGMEPSEIMTGLAGNHRAFSVSDPDGYVVTVFTSHVIGPV